MTRSLPLLASTLASLAALAAPATAQSMRPDGAPAGAAPPAADVRQGLTFGFGLGAGNLSCEDTTGTGDGPCNGVTEAGGIDGHIGGMVRPNLALIGEVWVMGHTENRLTVTQAIATAGVQFWLLPRLWIRGGLGAARASFHYRGILVNVDDRTESVPAAMAAIGYEILTSKNLALDIQLRGGTGFYKDSDTKAHSEALSVGLNWY